MSIRIRLAEGETLVIQVNPDAWSRAYTRALDSNSVIEVHGRDGRTLAINPHQILFWEEVPEESEEPGQAAASPEAQPA